MDQNTPRETSKEQANAQQGAVRTALVVLALCFTLAVLGRGLSESFTVFLKPISENFGWDRAQVVSIYSLTWLISGLTAPLVGRLFDHSGPRIVYALGLLLLGSAFLIAGHAQALWQFQLSIGLCVGIGVAFIGNVPNSILLGRWFGPKLPTAMAVVYSAMGGGVLALLPASQLLIDHLGWRETYQLFGFAALGLLVPLMLLPWRLFATGSPHVAKKTDPDFVDHGWTLVSAMRHHAFWALFSTFFFTAVGMYCDRRADRRLSDRCRLPAAAGRDRLGLFGRRAGVRHDRRLRARRPDRAPAVGAAELRDLDPRHLPALAACSIIRTSSCSPASSSASAA